MSEKIYLPSYTPVQKPEEKISICFQNQYYDAARHNRIEELRKILGSYHGNSHKINNLNKERLSALHYAVRYGNIECAREIIAASPSSIHVKGKHEVHPIHYAARFFRPEHLDENEEGENVIELLLKHGADINARDAFSFTPLQYASVSDNIHALRILLKHSKDNIENADPSGVTALHSTCFKGHIECSLLLIKNGAKVSTVDRKNMSALHYAAKSDNKYILGPLIKILEGEGNSYLGNYSLSYLLNLQNVFGETPLHLAIGEENLEACQFLVKKGADVNIAKNKGLSPLHVAAVKNNLEIVKLLVTEGAKITSTDELKEIPLHKAARNDKVEIVKYLLEVDPDQVNIEDLDKQTPLIEAAAKNNASIAEILLAQGANIEICDNFQKTSLFWAAQNNSIDVLKILLEHIKDNEGEEEFEMKDLIERKDQNEFTPLHIAAQQGHVEIVEILIEHGACVDTVNDSDRTPLHTAAENGFTDVGKVLIQTKPSIIDKENTSGYTAVHLAAISGKNEMLRFLLQNGADNDPQDNHMLTPLALASFEGHIDCVKTLLDHRAAVEARGPNNKTPLFFAAGEGHAEVVKLLLDHGANVNIKDIYGFNLLDVAIKERKVEVANVLLDRPEWKCVLRNGSQDGSGSITSPMGKMIETMPAMAKKALDKCMKGHDDTRNVTAEEKTRSVEITYEFIDDSFADWLFLSGTAQPIESPFQNISRAANELMFRRSKSQKRKEEALRKRHKPPLSILCREADGELLNHPVVSTLIELKWQKFGKPVFYSKFIVFLVFLIFLTGYVLTITPLLPKTTFPETANGDVNETCQRRAKYFSVTDNAQDVFFLVIGRTILLALSSFQLFLELMQMVNRKFAYFKDFTNYLELVMYCLALVYLLPTIDNDYLNNCQHVPLKTSIGACVIFLAWCDLLLFIRKFSNFGIYVVMFIDVLKTFLRFSLTFSMFIIAFALVFHSLIGPNKPLFGTIGRSFTKTMAMTIGEFGYEEIFNKMESKALPLITWFLFALFLIVMTILLMNMLVGLAVDDIKSVLSKAEIERTKMRVELVLNVEKMLPNWARRRWGRFTDEEFTHYLSSGVYKKKDKNAAEEHKDEDSDNVNENEGNVKEQLV